MKKVKEALKKAGSAFMDAMKLEEGCGPEDLLEKAAAYQKYEKLGIYDNGEIVVPAGIGDAFLDCVETFAFIKSVKAAPLGDIMPGLAVYSLGALDYDFGPVTELSTWLALVGNGYTDALKENEDNALRFALASGFAIPTEAFDLLYAAYPETELADVLYNCKRLDAVKWAVEHGADRYYDGFTEPMQKILSWTKRGPEAEAIYRYLYDDDPVNYGKEKAAC